MLDSTTKQCSRCKEIKPVSEFWKNQQTRTKYHSMCRICASSHEKNRRRENPEKSRTKAIQRSKRRLAQGLCARCGKINDTPNFTKCTKCREYVRAGIDKRKPYTQHRASCVICGFEYSDVHHIDGNHKNNDLSNLISLCPNHHRMVHWGLLSITKNSGESNESR